MLQNSEGFVRIEKLRNLQGDSLFSLMSVRTCLELGSVASLNSMEAVMAKVPEEMVHQTTRRAIEATNFGVNWFREMAEQNIGQTRNAMETLITATRRAVDGLNHQGAVFQQQSLLLAEKTLSNTLEFGNKVVRVREPQELVHLQSEFMTKQAELFAEHAKKLDQSVGQATSEIASIHKGVRSRSEAA